MHSISFILESSLLFAKHFLHQNISVFETLPRWCLLVHTVETWICEICQICMKTNVQDLFTFITFIQIFHFDKKKETIWCLLRLSRIWKILVNLFKSLLNWKSRQNIWNNLEKSSKIGQGKKGLVSNFLCFCQNLISARNTDHRLNSSLRFF